MHKALKYTAIAVALGFGALVWLAFSADFVTFSKTNGLAFVKCDNPKELNNSSCQKRFCEMAIENSNAIPLDYELVSTGMSAREGNPQVIVDGQIKTRNSSTDSAQHFRCWVTNATVDKFEVVDGKEWAQKVADGEWDF